ncbi:MAG: fatty acid desaturase [Stenomitos frigidus ULC029]
MTLLEEKPQQGGRSMQATTSNNGYTGLAIAGTIFTVWLTSLLVLLQLESRQPLLLLFAILWQTFLYAGLFITAHDAMHNCIVPQHPKVNHGIGFLALLFYGWLPYRKLRKAHWQHHQYPASEADPDFHNGKDTHGLLWYARFMGRYWSWWQLSAIAGTYHFLSRVLHVSETNLILFWAVPSLLSSAQLFYFGTFLAHREPPDGYQNPLRANSVYRPYIWSLLTCYHFGYHQEHHAYPQVPWWRLPDTIAPVAALPLHSVTFSSLCKDK